MSIWITGDCHSDVRRFNIECFPEQKEMDQDNNYVIILGDFGLIWNRDGENGLEKYWLDWLDNKPFYTLFIDGNHECFDRLYDYPVKEWKGGKIHEIRPHVLHLMRGEVFTIENKTFFTFGGASSHDIHDGILDYNDPKWKDKAEKLDRQGKYMYRVKGLSWWEQELPTSVEMQNGFNNLDKHGNKVDFILSHSPSTSELILLGGKGLYKKDVLTDYLDDVKANVTYQRRFMGHMHINRFINDKDICLYEQIIRIN